MASSTAAGGISWGGMLSYWTMMSMVIQSSRLEQAMNVELAQMALLTDQSMSLQQASLASQNFALEQEQVAASEQAEVDELQNEASVLLEKSHTDMELATTTEQEAIDELTVQVTTEEEQSTQHVATAALDEETYEHELEQATADAAEATRLGTLAHGDEASVALCEWIPFLDVVCDWVGGITAVGMESDAASIGARSSSELLSASAAKIDEQVEIDLAVDFKTKSVQDTATLGELQTEQDELIATAKEERAEAEALELQADELQQDIETDEEQAAQSEIEAEDLIPDENGSEQEEIDIHELLFNELTEIIGSSHTNKSLTEWMIGERLRKTLSIITDSEKAKTAFKELQKTIASKFGKEYTSEKLYECLKLADEFPDISLFSEISEDLSLEHLQLIIEIESDLERTYYCEMAKQEKWSADELKKKISDKTFEKEFGED